MSLMVLLLSASLAGLVTKRWWSLGLGLVAGVVSLGVAVLSGHPNDNPAIVLAAIATMGIAAGVTTGRRLGSRSA